ncbi:MAG: 2-oxoacid:acceptor oxidoreductase family protein [Acidobacteriota bacterium]|nr:2-oxoacid:acceptor oxidoreductase family protein [Acidobacteriota bacterium]
MLELTLAFVGSGGDGAVSADDIVATACASKGLHVIKTEAYGPQIRGGESSSTVRVSSAPIHAQADEVDVLVVFNWADFARFHDELTLAGDAIIFHEPGEAPPPKERETDEISDGAVSHQDH